MESPRNLRLFFAVELPEEIIGHLSYITNKLYRYGLPSIKWVDVNNIHLTLKFLGDTSENLVDSITSTMRTTVSDVSPFILQIKGIGTFPNMRRPRILWAGVKGNLEPVARIKNRLEQTMEMQGFVKEQRPFSPHLTIGRINAQLSPQELERLDRAIPEINNLSPVYMQVNALSLIESRLTRSGAIYFKTAQWELGTS